MMGSIEWVVSDEGKEKSETDARPVRERRLALTDVMLESYTDAEIIAMFTSDFEYVTEAGVHRQVKVGGVGLWDDDPELAGVAAVLVVRGVLKDSTRWRES